MDGFLVVIFVRVLNGSLRKILNTCVMRSTSTTHLSPSYALPLSDLFFSNFFHGTSIFSSAYALSLLGYEVAARGELWFFPTL